MRLCPTCNQERFINEFLHKNKAFITESCRYCIKGDPDRFPRRDFLKKENRKIRHDHHYRQPKFKVPKVF